MSRSRTARSRKTPTEAAGLGRPEITDLLLGWKADDGRAPMGFSAPRMAEAPVEGEVPILYGEDRHLLTIAPTGAGKGRGVIIPNLLRFEGSVIVIDPKGETWHVTARRRKEMGQEVRLLDPLRTR